MSISLKPMGIATLTAAFLGVALVTPNLASAEELISIRNGKVYDGAGTLVTKKSAIYAYNAGNFVCPVDSVVTQSGHRVYAKDSAFVCYYYKNNRTGVASVIIKGVNSKGYKDSLLTSYKIGNCEGHRHRQGKLFRQQDRGFHHQQGIHRHRRPLLRLGSDLQRLRPHS